MTVIISHRIQRKEFIGGLIAPRDLQTILGAFKKGIFTILKGENLPKASRLIKVYATTISGARRIVFLVDVLTNDAFFLFYRSKNDKLGKNISIKNQDFRNSLHQYLALLDADLDQRAVDIYNI